MNCVHTTSIRFDSMAGYTEAETKKAFEKALGFTTKLQTLQVKGTYIINSQHFVFCKDATTPQDSSKRILS